MKNARFAFLILIICNYSFSQEQQPEPPKENQLPEKIEVFKFHPNPVEDELFVIGTHKIKSIEIMDALGKSVAVHQFDKSIIRMNVAQLESGIYFLKAIDKYDQQAIKKLVVK
ncbi:T9SS type A sorting domain-containing protein [uncultured Psychroserpens sp.]|uniref:T9SS type A sorting domain-containing protein n=1 Tax=uncultured Psychroserpens sp. TaxID=255436 RepID=UPI002601D4FB|nr:T9SS type A sorting domain-containing protein [uncultured Psychroserpens sp.]